MPPKITARLLASDSKTRAIRRMNEIGVSPGGLEYMTDKSVLHLIRVDNLGVQAANFLKQEMLSRGGDAIISFEALCLKGERTNCLLYGTEKQFRLLYPKLLRQAFGLKKLGQDLEDLFEILATRERKITIRGRMLTIGRTPWLVGILNVTPDSFYDGGRYTTLDKVLDRAREIEEDGADVIELGAQSAVPGTPISVSEEKDRLLKALRKVRINTDLPISVDTYSAEVAKAALKAGADIINDITALEDPEMAKVMAKSGAHLVLMHIKGRPKVRQHRPKYVDVMAEVSEFLHERTVRAISAGVAEGKIIVDPGIGFGKDTSQNLTVIRRLSEVRSLGFPVMFSASHKSFIGDVLDLPVPDRLEGTLAANTLALMSGVDLFRVHEVKEHKRALSVAQAIRSAEGVQ